MAHMQLTPFEVIAIWSVLGIAVLGLLYAVFLVRQISKEDKGTPEMQEVWGYIKTGANTYLRQQLRTIALFLIVLIVALFASVWVVRPSPEAREAFGDAARLWVAFGRAGAFLLGATFSASVGFIGMNMAVEGNVRVASASRRSFGEALRIAYRSGTITGMLTDGLGLFGGTAIFMIFGKAAPDALLGFGFGGTLLALFMRVGGGIYTKAADVGADLVGKVEAGLEEDDPRNAAVIADLVGDNVGDCAGMAADIFESYEVTIVSALILGLALVRATGQLQWIVFPLLVRAIGVFSSIIGTYFVRSLGEGDTDAMVAINRGFYTSAAISILGFLTVTLLYMRTPGTGTVDWAPFFTTFVGIILAIVIDEVTKYFTDTHYAPVKEIARSTQFGAATTILSGMASGYESSAWGVLVIAMAMLASVLIYAGHEATFILYGVAMTGIGMLTLTGNNVSMDSFGPIVDNANGIGEVVGMEDNARQIMADLDAVGNTTKAITKGVAIASAVIAAVSLFGSFITDSTYVQVQLGVPKEQLLSTLGINLASPLVFIGLLIGGSLPILFVSLMIRAVNRAASLIIGEVRRQFRDEEIWAGRKVPDYARAVHISTVAAQQELLPLATIAILTPIVVGFLLKAEALGGFLGGIILSGQLLAVYMANSGGAWDNAKKTIEDGLYGGKHSDAHNASVVGDTVGDPLKDTAGPALNPMIKVVNLVSLIIAPIVVAHSHVTIVTWIAMIVLLGLIAWAVTVSKRETDLYKEAESQAVVTVPTK